MDIQQAEGEIRETTPSGEGGSSAQWHMAIHSRCLDPTAREISMSRTPRGESPLGKRSQNLGRWYGRRICHEGPLAETRFTGHAWLFCCAK